MPEPPRRPFLTARWHFLAMLNYRIDAAVLSPLVPAGTELDTWQGEAIVSLVGFRFLDTRLCGLPVPFHRDFDEVNLRFYVRRLAGGEVRRGVSFIKEIVPRRAIAAVARFAYNEPYVACPMRSRTPGGLDAAEPGAVEYAWRAHGRWHRLGVTTSGEASRPAAGSEAEFITEHYWGYTPQRDGSTIEYEVRHPPWRVWTGDSVLDCDAARMYGPAFAASLRGAPRSAFLADGSPVSVGSPAPVRVATRPLSAGA
jgi:uncharacterized protein YqjF (DUF2071 family)